VCHVGEKMTGTFLRLDRYLGEIPINLKWSSAVARGVCLTLDWYLPRIGSKRACGGLEQKPQPGAEGSDEAAERRPHRYLDWGSAAGNVSVVSR
jgi:hypothetical protein